MSCRECQQAILDEQKSLEKKTEVGSSEAVASHLLLCLPCRLFAQRQRRLREGLGLLAAADASIEAPPELEARLRAMLQPPRVAPARPRRLSLDGSWRRGTLTVGALAAGLLLVSWLSVRWLRSSPAHPAGSVAVAVRTPSLPLSEGRPPVLLGQAEAPVRHEPTPSLPRRRPARSTARPAPLPAEELSKRGDSAINEAEKTDEEVVTDFFPLYAGQQLVPLERGRLIRTRVPRSMLGAFGLPVHPDWAILPIKADVVVGEDGTARAVRFVREEP